MKPPFSRRPGFTLIELLVVIAIIAILAALAFPIFGKMRSASDRTAGLSNLRQVGLGFQSYSADNDGRLPGPLWTGQGVWYNKWDDRTLPVKLWRYLQLTEPDSVSREAPVIGNSAYYRMRQTSASPALMLNNYVSDGQSYVNPWGYKDGSGNVTAQPLKVIQIASPSTQWAMRDVDQTYPGVQTAGWYSDLPKKPVFGDARATLFFDLSARLVPIL